MKKFCGSKSSPKEEILQIILLNPEKVVKRENFNRKHVKPEKEKEKDKRR